MAQPIFVTSDQLAQIFSQGWRDSQFIQEKETEKQDFRDVSFAANLNDSGQIGQQITSSNVLAEFPESKEQQEQFVILPKEKFDSQQHLQDQNKQLQEQNQRLLKYNKELLQKRRQLEEENQRLIEDNFNIKRQLNEVQIRLDKQSTPGAQRKDMEILALKQQIKDLTQKLEARDSTSKGSTNTIQSSPGSVSHKSLSGITYRIMEPKNSSRFTSPVPNKFDALK